LLVSGQGALDLLAHDLSYLVADGGAQHLVDRHAEPSSQGPLLDVPRWPNIAGTESGAIVRHGSKARKMGIPLGPFLALGSVVALFAGHPLLHLYLHH
jgi:hypothetical protein